MVGVDQPYRHHETAGDEPQLVKRLEFDEGLLNLDSVAAVFELDLRLELHELRVRVLEPEHDPVEVRPGRRLPIHGPELGVVVVSLDVSLELDLAQEPAPESCDYLGLLGLVLDLLGLLRADDRRA